MLTLHKVFEPQMIFIGLGIGGMHPSAVYNVHQMSCMCRVRPQFSLSIHVDTKFDSTSFHYILGIYKLLNIKIQDKFMNMRLTPRGGHSVRTYTTLKTSTAVGSIN